MKFLARDQLPQRTSLFCQHQCSVYWKFVQIYCGRILVVIMMNVAGLHEKVVNRSGQDNALAAFLPVNIKQY